jgi:imidazolonepropionase-like amidohydrolase
MKSFFKKTLKVSFACFLVLALTLGIGVLLPKDTYPQKEERFANLLITGCNIVDVKNDRIIPNQQILVQNGKIVSMDSIITSLPGDLQIVEADGQYLMPSLWDMHVHTLSLSPQLHFPLLMAHGVTGIRDLGDGDSWISDIDDTSERDRAIWERQTQHENLLVPKIIESTSYHVEELDDTDTINFKIKVEELVRKLKNRNESFVKVQLEEAALPDYIFYELQHQARKHQIPILGHLSPNLDIDQVVANGFKSIEHAWALIPHGVNEWVEKEGDIEQKRYELEHQDSLKTQHVLRAMAASGVYYVPTHVTSNKKEYMAFDPDFNDNPNNVYTENVQMVMWKLFRWLITTGYDQETDLAVLKGYYHRGLELTRLAQQNGVKLLAGTDALDVNVHYGISLHEELGEMVKAGLSNAEALRTATSHAAEYYGLTEEYGSIEIGKKADFILLSKNPLEDIANTKTIEAVCYNNRWYTRKDLEEMKSFVRQQAKSFGVSCTFIWNMIKRN